MTAVEIAISCYNAAPWLDRAFEAIAAQEGPAWRIVAFNDGSQDATDEILRAWQARLGSRMRLIDNPGNHNFGVSLAYDRVLSATEAPWVLLADSDDVWLPGHLTTVVEALQRQEADTGAATPVVVCTDARVIDEHDAVISPSFWRWDRSHPWRMKKVSHVTMDCPALGPTMGVNRALLDLALPIPRGAKYQDWWLASVAAAFGVIRVVDEPTILYRRHSANVTGTQVGSLRGALASPGRARARTEQLIGQRSPQAAAFLERYASRLPASEVAAMAAIGRLERQGPLARRASILRHRLTFTSPLKTAGLLLLC